MVASACLTLALGSGLVWCRRREARAHALFALMAAATALVAACELWLMRAETTGELGVALRWLHLPVWMVIVSLVGFVRLHLRAGRLWLGWVVNNSRFLVLPERQCYPNLASRVLALALKRLSADWQEHWGHPVLFVESYADESKYPGTSYRARGVLKRWA